MILCGFYYLSVLNQNPEPINTKSSIQKEWQNDFLNNEELLQRVYQENLSSVIIYVTNNSGSKEQAEDIYHEAFLAVWRNMQLDRFTAESESSFRGYLIRVAKNKWIDYLRSKGFKVTAKLDELTHHTDTGQPEHKDETDEYIDKVVSGFSQLKENCRELLTLFYYKNKTMKKIAELFGWTEATARNNKYRCLQKLRDIINNIED